MKANQVAELAAALPLAEASYRLLRSTCDQQRLNELYELHRGVDTKNCSRFRRWLN